jgi:hypothetical protein
MQSSSSQHECSTTMSCDSISTMCAHAASSAVVVSCTVAVLLPAADVLCAVYMSAAAAVLCKSQKASQTVLQVQLLCGFEGQHQIVGLAKIDRQGCCLKQQGPLQD